MDNLNEAISLICRFAIDFNPALIGQINGDIEAVATRFNSVLIREYL